MHGKLKNTCDPGVIVSVRLFSATSFSSKVTRYRVFVPCGHSLMLPVAAVMHVGVETGLPVGDVVHGADRPVRLHQRVLTWIQRRLLTGSMGLGYETDLLDDKVGVCPHVPTQKHKIPILSYN